jgi:hypothetical protein
MVVNRLQSAAKDAGRDWRAGITEEVLEAQLTDTMRRGGAGDSSDEEGPGSEQDSSCAVRFFNLTPNQLTCQLLDAEGNEVDEGQRDVHPAAYDDSWVSKQLWNESLWHYFGPEPTLTPNYARRNF